MCRKDQGPDGSLNWMREPASAPICGAGSVNPPVFASVEKGFIIPALPIWKTEEFEMLLILIIFIWMDCCI